MTTKGKKIHILEATKNYLERPPSEKIALEGWKEFNKALGGGFLRSTLNVVCARSGFGKTNYLTWISLQLLSVGKKVLFASIELTEEKMLERFLASVLGINYNQMSNVKKEHPETIENLLVHLKDAYPLQFIFCETIEDLYELASEAKISEDYDYLVIDHIHELQTKQEFKFENQKLPHIVSYLEKLYKEQEMTIITAAQFVKGMDKGSDFGERTLDDIAGSSVLRNKCSNIIYLYETEEQMKYNQGKINEGKANLCQCHLKLLKARDGWGNWDTKMYYDRGKVMFTIDSSDNSFNI